MSLPVTGVTELLPPDRNYPIQAQGTKPEKVSVISIYSQERENMSATKSAKNAYSFHKYW